MKKHRSRLKERLEQLYHQYNRREFVDPDPLLFLYTYPDLCDREIAGLVASCLAYGRVEMIMKAVGDVLNPMGVSPWRYLMKTSKRELHNQYRGFKYRFATKDHLCSLLSGIQWVIGQYGSLENCFATGQGPVRVRDGLTRLYTALCQNGDVGHLLADPGKTSACKRSHLFLRWMVRRDKVDPGGWRCVTPSQLICPIDTHMHRIGILLGFTRRKVADHKCAMEITAGFRGVDPWDPVRYDFALTRFGIRRQFDIEELGAFIYKKE